MPAKFRFALEPLLEMRKRGEEQRRRDLAACGRILAECREQLDRFADVRRECLQTLVAGAGFKSAAELALRDAHLRCLDRAVEKERGRGVELEAAFGRAQEALVAASRERRVIEKLKERRRRAFDSEEARRDELELDESNIRQCERIARERLVRRETETAAP